MYDARFCYLRMVQLVGTHGDWIRIDGQKHLVSGTGESLREPTGSTKEVHDRGDIKLFNPPGFGIPECRAKISQLAILAVWPKPLANGSTVADQIYMKRIPKVWRYKVGENVLKFFVIKPIEIVNQLSENT